ncbi:PadR family transcriptional regulator [Nocardiopsis sp. CNT-189]|uniref:helix-turn-helix transcriptional regulator n=1 Tax=Nocardiopsis oceanisediminis TaxID=2816862 RepID=UPI003B347A6E
MALRRSDRDLTGLTVLALLTTGPRHTYEMHRMMVGTHKDFVTGLPRSMYHAVERLHRDGLVEAVGTTRGGARPERTVYAITRDGRAALRDRELRLLRTPDRDTTPLVAALSFLGVLPPGEAAAALRDRAKDLDGQHSELARALGEAEGRLPRLLLIENEYEAARIAAERDWVSALADDLDAGGLDAPAGFAGLSVPGSDPEPHGPAPEPGGG